MTWQEIGRRLGGRNEDSVLTCLAEAPDTTTRLSVAVSPAAIGEITKPPPLCMHAGGGVLRAAITAAHSTAQRSGSPRHAASLAVCSTPLPRCAAHAPSQRSSC